MDNSQTRYCKVVSIISQNESRVYERQLRHGGYNAEDAPWLWLLMKHNYLVKLIEQSIESSATLEEVARLLLGFSAG
jgi:hypothetical protein